jgi:hypothetical protein
MENSKREFHVNHFTGKFHCKLNYCNSAGDRDTQVLNVVLLSYCRMLSVFLCIGMNAERE